MPKSPFNFYQEGHYVDDQFKLAPNRTDPQITIKRLKDIFPPNTPLFVDTKTGASLRNPTKNRICPTKPFYLAEMNMLPFSHYRTLIEPAYVNEKGHYHVVMYKEGSMFKEVVDDTFYFD